jgi:hypothetical protein
VYCISLNGIPHSIALVRVKPIDFRHLFARYSTRRPTLIDAGPTFHGPPAPQRALRQRGHRGDLSEGQEFTMCLRCESRCVLFLGCRCARRLSVMDSRA